MACSGMRRFEGKVAIVTGGSNGIGAAIARKFVTEGAYVYIADIDEEAGVKLCQDLHGNASFVNCDVAVETHVKGVVDQAMEEKGRLDIMVNNAGMLHAHGNSITQVSVESWERVMAVNVRGSMLGMKHAARVMIPQNSGSILFNCSVLGLVKTDNASHGYMASKNALLGLMKSGAVELAKVGIRVNAVSSFGIMTKMIEEWLDEVSNGMCPKEVLEDEMERNATNGRKPSVAFAAQRATMSYWIYNRVEFDFDGDWRNSQVIYNDFDCKWLEERLGIFVPENEMDMKVRENHLEQIVEAAREDMDAQDEYLFFKWSQADEDSVYDLPLVKIDEELQCLICIEDMKIGETGKELPCEHVFHDGCIEEWLLDYNHVCPICKFELPVAEIDDS